MTAGSIVSNIGKAIKANQPEILTGLGVGGVITTSYLTGKASFKAAGKLSDRDPYMSNKERIKLVWKLYIPATVSGAITIACMMGSTKASGRRTAAAVTAYSVTEKMFSDYKDKVVEQIGENKEQKIRDGMAQERVNQNPLGTREVIMLGKGEVLFCELYTGRYFRSNMESLQQARNVMNDKINNQMYVALDEFYDLLGLGYTSESSKTGWDSDKGLMELEFSAVIADNQEPCMAFEYNYTKPLS